jgi:hypothetical protein
MQLNLYKILYNFLAIVALELKTLALAILTMLAVQF